MPYESEFYEQRLSVANDPRKAVWDGAPEQWELVHRDSIAICAEHVHAGMMVLDAGCGIGELAECLPPGVGYLGIDYCQGFVEVARKRYPGRRFEVVNLLELDRFHEGPFDLCICRTVEGVLGPDAWPGIVQNLLRFAPRILVFRAMIVEGETANTVHVFERPAKTREESCDKPK